MTLLATALGFLVVATGGCGEDCPRGEPLSVELAERYGWLGACLGFSLDHPLPTALFVESIPCPTSGKPCLASDGHYPCPSGFAEGAQCGTAGKTSECGTILMPDADGGDRVFEHEALHWMLFQNTGNIDGSHFRDDWDRLAGCTMPKDGGA